MNRSPGARTPLGAALTLGAALALGACAGGGLGRATGGGATPRAGTSTTPPAPSAGTPPGGSAAAPAAAVGMDDVDALLGEMDRLLALWDAAQGAGSLLEADRLQAELRQRAQASFDALAAAARGSRGQAGAYVGTMSMAFAPAGPVATQVLVERLREQDPRLVANALIALKLRADPATPLEPIVTHVGSVNADVRRYAPLALARVLEARREANLPTEPALEGEALRRLGAFTRDMDPLVRLHVAKALGELRLKAAADVLLTMLDDTSERVRLGAAAGLARHGNRPGFERTVHLLHGIRPEAQPLVAAVLVTHAGRLQGSPLTSEEVQRLGTSAPAWARWYADFVKRVPAAPPGPAGPAPAPAPPRPPAPVATPAR